MITSSRHHLLDCHAFTVAPSFVGLLVECLSCRVETRTIAPGRDNSTFRGRIQLTREGDSCFTMAAQVLTRPELSCSGFPFPNRPLASTSWPPHSRRFWCKRLATWVLPGAVAKSCFSGASWISTALSPRSSLARWVRKLYIARVAYVAFRYDLSSKNPINKCLR